MYKSVSWVTNLKAFGIVTVVLGHITTPFSEFIYSWHMPLFFMLSGFFIKSGVDLKTLIVKDWCRLMMPYFIFAILALLITHVKQWGLNRGSLNWLGELSAIFYWMDYKHLKNSYAYVLWFLPTLFFAKILCYLIIKYIPNLIFQNCAFVFCFIVSFHLYLPFGH